MSNSNNSAGHTTEVSSLQELAREIKPPRDLWPEIEARLSAARRNAPLHTRARNAFNLRAPWTQVAVLAMLAVLVGGGVWVGHGSRTSRIEATAGVDAGAAPMVVRIVRSADPRYTRERTALLRSLPTQIAGLPPESRAKVTASLTAIHKAMQDMESALGRDSSNALLQELLINTYQDEMRVLTAVHEASSAGKEI